MENKPIPLSIPNLNGNELKYVTDAITTGWVSTAGSYVGLFEDNLASYVKSKGAVACQSGTAGLHLALKALDITAEREVIVPTLTFIAAVNPVRYVGADPVFMDCDDSLGIDPGKIQAFINDECEYIDNELINMNTNKPIKAIVVVHVFGNMADMESIMEIADHYNLAVIEDATEALGTYYTAGKYSGNYAGTIGDIGVFSFNGNKIITTGGGGMVVSNREHHLNKVRYLATQAKDDAFNYQHDEIGYNYRMTNVQAALGVAQLEQLETFIETKRQNYQLYQTLLEPLKDVTLLEFRDNTRPNYWFYGLRINSDSDIDKNTILDKLGNENIQVRPVWQLIHNQKPYQHYYKYKIEKAELYFNQVINIPCSSNLSAADVSRVTQNIKSIMM